MKFTPQSRLIVSSINRSHILNCNFIKCPMMYEQKWAGYEIKNIASREGAPVVDYPRDVQHINFWGFPTFGGCFPYKLEQFVAVQIVILPAFVLDLYTRMKNGVNVERMTKRKGTQCTFVSSIKQTTIVKLNLFLTYKSFDFKFFRPLCISVSSFLYFLWSRCVQHIYNNSNNNKNMSVCQPWLNLFLLFLSLCLSLSRFHSISLYHLIALFITSFLFY